MCGMGVPEIAEDLGAACDPGCDLCGHDEGAHAYPFRCGACAGGKCPPPPPPPEDPPRCPDCCVHGLPFSAADQKRFGTSGWCGWCEDVLDGYDDGPFMDEPQWLCPHGIGDPGR